MSGDCRAVSPSLNRGAALCYAMWEASTQGSILQNQCVKTDRQWSLMSFSLPPLCASVTRNQISQCDHQCTILDFHSYPSSADWSQDKPKKQNAPSRASPGKC